MRASKIDLLQFARDCYSRQKNKNPWVQGHMTRKINKLKDLELVVSYVNYCYEQTF